MKKIISLTAVSLMLSLVIIDSPAAFAGGGPAAPAPVRRTVPQKAAPAPTTPSAPAAPASNPASAPAATVPMANPYGSPYSGNYGPYDCSNGSCYNGGCSSGYCQSCNRGTTVVVTTGGNRCSGCARSECCGGRCLVMRLMNHGNIAGARAVLRSMNRSFYFGECASPCY